jgi:hypothetical protein
MHGEFGPVMRQCIPERISRISLRHVDFGGLARLQFAVSSAEHDGHTLYVTSWCDSSILPFVTRESGMCRERGYHWDHGAMSQFTLHVLLYLLSGAAALKGAACIEDNILKRSQRM